jgi:outer membrane protein assembly factor BamA
VLLASLTVRASAQEVQPPAAPQHPDEGKIVQKIEIEPAVDYAASLIRVLKTKVGEPLRAVAIQEDLRDLWRLRQIRVDEVYTEPVDGGVAVIFVVVEQRAYDRIEFFGLEDLSDKEVRTFLGIVPGQRINRVAAEKHALALRDRYQRNGYAFVDVRITEDADRSVLSMFVDEGPKVTVRQVWFRGNESFPSWALFGLYDNLRGSSGMKSREGGLFSGNPYSEEILEEDLDRIRFFYRKQGYRDALGRGPALPRAQHRPPAHRGERRAGSGSALSEGDDPRRAAHRAR